MCLYPKEILIQRAEPVFFDSEGQPHYFERVTVACGKCFECQKAKSVEWASRIVLEASLHSKNCVITLTYDNEHVQKNLDKKHLQDFIKRVRSHFAPQKLRVFYCGEYGSRGRRPHYHIILFGVDFDDKFYWHKSNRGNVQYRSFTLEKLWPFGFSTIGELSFDTALYCAKYLQKFNDVSDLVPPFIGMSLKPGIGLAAMDKFVSLDSNCMFINGKSYKIPRYFLDKIEASGVDLSKLKYRKLVDGFRKERSREQLCVAEKKYKHFLKKS